MITNIKRRPGAADVLPASLAFPPKTAVRQCDPGACASVENVAMLAFSMMKAPRVVLPSSKVTTPVTVPGLVRANKAQQLLTAYTSSRAFSSAIVSGSATSKLMDARHNQHPPGSRIPGGFPGSGAWLEEILPGKQHTGGAAGDLSDRRQHIRVVNVPHVELLQLFLARKGASYSLAVRNHWT